jgi:hypothetical protein
MQKVRTVMQKLRFNPMCKNFIFLASEPEEISMFQQLAATVYLTEDYNGKPLLSIHFGPDQCILISETYGVCGFLNYSGAGPTVRRLCDILEWRNMAGGDDGVQRSQPFQPSDKLREAA